jgi:squalene synthase HpnC
MIRQVIKGGRATDGESPGPHEGGAPGSSRSPSRWLDPPVGPWTLERAYGYCEEFVRAHHEIYPVASRLVPAAIRPHLMAVYAFARSADDFADEPEYEGHRQEALSRWENELHLAAHGEATHPVFIALGDTIEKRDLSVPPLEDLLAAFRMDMDVRRYATFAALRGYTARSAESAGRLLLALFGYRQPELVRFADEISTALQLTSFWQDVAADAARDHIYIPAEDMHFFGVTELDIKTLKPTKAIRDILRYQVARTRALYERGRPLLSKLGNDLKMELALIWLVGNAILDKIEDADYDVFTTRPTIGRRDKAKIMAKAATHWATRLDLSTFRRLWP